MIRYRRYALSVGGAVALCAGAFSTASASHIAPFGQDARSAARHTTVTGDLFVTHVLRVQNNQSTYGHLYAHNSEQVWKGLLIHSNGLNVLSGGIKADALDVSGPLAAQSGTISGNLAAGTLQSAGSIAGGTLSLTSGATVGGKLTAAGGVDAGSGGVTTSGNIAAGGQISAAAAAIKSLVVSGSVDFSNASVSGLNLANLNLANANLQSLNVGSPTSATSPLSLSENGQSAVLGVDSAGSLTVRSLVTGALSTTSLSLGSQSSSASALTLSGNGHSSALGVDSNGSLALGPVAVTGSISATGNEAIGGNLVVSGAQGVVANTLQAPNAPNTTTPGALTVLGSSIALNGSTTANGSLRIAAGNDLNLSTSSGGNDAHFLANGSADTSGFVDFNVPVAPAGSTTSINYPFHRAFPQTPVVVITPSTDPAPSSNVGNSNVMPKMWVSASTTSFTIHFVAPGAVTTAYPITFGYHVIGR